MHTQLDTLLRLILLAEHSRRHRVKCMQTNLPCSAILHATMQKHDIDMIIIIIIIIININIIIITTFTIITTIVTLKQIHASCRMAAKHMDEGGSAAPPPPSGSTPAGHDDGLGPILPDFGSLLHADKPDARRCAKLHVSVSVLCSTGAHQCMPMLALHLLRPASVPSVCSQMTNQRSRTAVWDVNGHVLIIQLMLRLELVVCIRHCIRGMNAIAKLIYMLQAAVEAFSHTSKASPSA